MAFCEAHRFTGLIEFSAFIEFTGFTGFVGFVGLRLVACRK